MLSSLKPPVFTPNWKWLAASMLSVASMLSEVSYGQTGIETEPAAPAIPFRSPQATTTKPEPARVQGGLPRELILPPPSDAAKMRASRFVEAEINPELPLSLISGRPKILRLSDTPKRIYVPNEDIIRAEAIDKQTGRSATMETAPAQFHAEPSWSLVRR